MKRIVAAWLLIGCMMFSAAAGAFAQDGQSSSFQDLKDLDAATKAKFDALIQAGVFDGVSEGQFDLKEEMNRAQFAKIAALIFGLQVDSSLKSSSFTDVKADDPANGYALPYIEAIKKAGITSGTGSGAFNPAGDVTKEQLAAFLVRGLGLEGEVGPRPGTADSTVSDWAKGYVQLALELKLLNREQSGEFGGKSGAKRDELIQASFETKKQVEPPPALSGAVVDGTSELKLTFTGAIDPKSIDLSQFSINGHVLSNTEDRFTLSEDGKTLIITFRPGFYWGSGSNPAIGVGAVQSTFGNKLDDKAPAPVVTVTNPPAPYIPASTPHPTNTPVPTATPGPTPSPEPSESTGPTESPNPTTTPAPNQLPEVSFVEPYSYTDLGVTFTVESSDTDTIYLIYHSGTHHIQYTKDQVKGFAIESGTNVNVRTVGETFTEYAIEFPLPEEPYTLYIIGENEHGLSEIKSLTIRKEVRAEISGGLWFDEEEEAYVNGIRLFLEYSPIEPVRVHYLIATSKYEVAPTAEQVAKKVPSNYEHVYEHSSKQMFGGGDNIQIYSPQIVELAGATLYVYAVIETGEGKLHDVGYLDEPYPFVIDVFN